MTECHIQNNWTATCHMIVLEMERLPSARIGNGFARRDSYHLMTNQSGPKVHVLYLITYARFHGDMNDGNYIWGHDDNIVGLLQNCLKVGHTTPRIPSSVH